MTKSKSPRGTFEEIKILALAAVENPDLEYFERQIQRSFSVTFHVSILEAENLTTEFMLQHLYEYRFEQQKLGERIEEARTLLMSPDERKERERQELERLDEDEVYLLRETQALAETPAKSTPKAKVPEIPDLPDELSIKFDPEPDPQ